MKPRRLVLITFLIFSQPCLGMDSDQAWASPARMKAAVARLVEEAKKRDTLWPWAAPLQEIGVVASFGPLVAPLLVTLLADDPDNQDEESPGWNVQQQAALALCMIYGVTEDGGHVYMNRASAKTNAGVKRFWIREISARPKNLVASPKISDLDESIDIGPAPSKAPQTHVFPWTDYDTLGTRQISYDIPLFKSANVRTKQVASVKAGETVAVLRTEMHSVKPKRFVFDQDELQHKAGDSVMVYRSDSDEGFIYWWQGRWRNGELAIGYFVDGLPEVERWTNVLLKSGVIGWTNRHEVIH